MLPSSGYFRGIACPGEQRGACQRPYCHFRHHGKVITDKSDPSPPACSSQGAAPSPGQEAEAGDEGQQEEPEHPGVAQELGECSAAALTAATAAAAMPSQPEPQQPQPHTSQQQQQQPATAPGEVPKSALLQQLMSEALKKVLAENPTLASTVDASSIRIGIDPVTQESPDSGKTKKQLFHRPPDTPRYNPTPIRELKKRKHSVDEVGYNPTSIAKLKAAKASGDEEGGMMGEFSSDESEEAEAEEQIDDFDLLEEVLAEHSKNNKVKVKKKKVKELVKLQYSLSNAHKRTVDNNNMITDAKRLTDKEVKRYEVPQSEVNKVITDGPYFLPPSPIFTSSSDGFDAFNAMASRHREEDESYDPTKEWDESSMHMESVRTNSQLATEKETSSPEQTPKHLESTSQPENKKKVTKASGHSHLPQQLVSANDPPKLSRPNIRTWTPLVRNNIPLGEEQGEEQGEGQGEGEGEEQGEGEKSSDQLDEMLQLMDGDEPSGKRKAKESERQTSSQRNSENGRPKKRYKVDLNKEIESLSNPGLDASKGSKGNVTPDGNSSDHQAEDDSQDSDKEGAKEDSATEDGNLKRREKEATKTPLDKDSEPKDKTKDSEAETEDSDDSDNESLDADSDDDSDYKRARRRKKRKRRSRSSSSGTDYSRHRRKKRKKSHKRHRKRSHKRSRKRRDSTSSQSDSSQESEEEKENKEEIENKDKEEEEEDTEEEEEEDEEEKENKSKDGSKSEDKGDSDNSGDSMELSKKSKKHRKKYKRYKKLKHKRGKHKARRRKRNKSYSRSRSTSRSRDSSGSGSRSRSSSKHRKRNRSRNKNRSSSEDEKRESAKEGSRSRSSSQSSSKVKKSKESREDDSGSKHTETSKSKSRREDESKSKEDRGRRDRSTSKSEQQTSDEKRTKNPSDEEASIPMPVDISKIKVEKNDLIPDLSKVKIEKEDPAPEKTDTQARVTAKENKAKENSRHEASGNKAPGSINERRRSSAEEKSRKRKGHEETKGSTDSTSDKAGQRRPSCDSKASDNEGSQHRKKTEERRPSTEKNKKTPTISSQPSGMSMFDLVLASSVPAKPKILTEISMFGSVNKVSASESSETKAKATHKSKDVSRRSSGESAVKTSNTVNSEHKEHKSSSSDKTSKSSSSRSEKTEKTEKTGHTDSHHRHDKSESKSSHSSSKSKSGSGSSSHHGSSSGHKRTSSTSSSRGGSSSKHHTTTTTTATPTTTTPTTTTPTTTTASSSSSSKTSDSSKSKKSSDTTSSKNEKESSRHSSSSSRKHSSSSRHHDNNSSSSSKKSSSGSSKHKEDKETSETIKINKGKETQKKKRIFASEDSDGGVSIDDQLSNRGDSPLPDLSALDEISQDDWEQMLSGLSANTSQEPLEETEGDDLDQDDPWVLEECMKVFNEFQPEDNHLENQVLPKKIKAEPDSKEPASNSKKQRVARSSTTGNLVARKSSSSRHPKSSPMQMMVERYQKLKEQLKMKDKQLNHLQGGPSTVSSSSSSNKTVSSSNSSNKTVSSSNSSSKTVSSSNSSSKPSVAPASSSTHHKPAKPKPPQPPSGKSKKRIAHVPNVTSLLDAQEKIYRRSPSRPNSRSRHSPMPAKASAPIAETLAHTVAKGGKRVAHMPKTGALARPLIQPELGMLVPQNIRQRYLNALIEECKKFSSEREAFSIAAAEERVCYRRAPSRMVYLNLVVNAVKRLRTQQAAGDDAQELLDKEPQLAEKMCIEEPSSSTAIASPASSPSPRPHPVNPNHVQLSHTSVLTAGGIKGSWSIEKPKKTASYCQAALKGEAFYKNLVKYILTEEHLGENGYPCPDPEEKGKAVVKKIDNRKKISPSALERYCSRCSVLYTVDKWGFPKSNTPCIHHWGRAYKKRKYGLFETSYSCCGGEQGSGGCCQATTHVSDNYSPKNLRGYVRTISKDTSKSNKEVYALDCEMCYTTEGNELTRITVINGGGDVVYEQLVKPENPILDYNTRFSGISESDMEDVKIGIRDVQAALLARFSDKTILIGHSLESDLHALKIIHNTVVDTAVVFPHKMGPPFKRALRNLAAEYLKKIIQDDVSGHDSAEDAVSALHLMQWKVKDDLKGFTK